MGALQSAKQNNAQVELVVSSKGRLQELTTKLVAYDAVFACTDLIAVELAVNLEVAGVKVPDDLKIVGFDDRPFSRLAYPSLTTARQFPERIGEKASSILVSIIKGNHISKKEVTVPVEIVIRKSCGCIHNVDRSIKNVWGGV